MLPELSRVHNCVGIKASAKAWKTGSGCTAAELIEMRLQADVSRAFLGRRHRLAGRKRSRAGRNMAWCHEASSLCFFDQFSGGVLCQQFKTAVLAVLSLGVIKGPTRCIARLLHSMALLSSGRAKQAAAGAQSRRSCHKLFAWSRFTNSISAGAWCWGRLAALELTLL